MPPPPDSLHSTFGGCANYIAALPLSAGALLLRRRARFRADPIPVLWPALLLLDSFSVSGNIFPLPAWWVIPLAAKFDFLSRSRFFFLHHFLGGPHTHSFSGSKPLAARHVPVFKGPGSKNILSPLKNSGPFLSGDGLSQNARSERLIKLF